MVKSISNPLTFSAEWTCCNESLKDNLVVAGLSNLSTKVPSASNFYTMDLSKRAMLKFEEGSTHGFNLKYFTSQSGSGAHVDGLHFLLKNKNGHRSWS